MRYSLIAFLLIGIFTVSLGGKEKSPSKATVAHSSRVVSAMMYPGSLKENMERLSKQFGWDNMIWDVPNDYRWVGRVKITADGFDNILAQVLKPYPVQAVFYEGNHILVLIPRTI